MQNDKDRIQDVDTSKLEEMSIIEIEAILRVIDTAITLQDGDVSSIRKMSIYKAQIKTYLRNRVENILSVNLLY